MYLIKKVNASKLRAKRKIKFKMQIWMHYRINRIKKKKIVEFSWEILGIKTKTLEKSTIATKKKM